MGGAADNMEVKGTSSESEKLEFKSQHSHFPDAWLWVSYFISQHLGFLSWKLGGWADHDDGDIFYRVALRTE